MDGFVVLLSGPPGAGKSTVAALLADSWERSVVLHLDGYFSAIRHSVAIHRGAVPPHHPESHSQNDTVLAAFAAAAGAYATGGYPVIAEGVIGPWFLSRFRALPVLVHYLVLRPDLPTTLRRATNRYAETALTDPEPVMALQRQFADLGSLEPHALDTTHDTPTHTTTRVRKALDTGEFGLR